MAHLRKRHAEALLDQVCRFSPIAGLLGHRQVGKTTLLEGFSASYYTLDQKAELTSARMDAETYLKDRKNKRMIIDECQLAPELFPALKEWVRKHKAPGQFVLSGSIRFTSRQAIRESMTGRIMNVELYPMVLSELEERPLPSAISGALTAQSLERFFQTPLLTKKEISGRAKWIEKYFEQGGLPGLCFIRDRKLRESKIDEQMRTLLDRDLRMLHKTQLPYAELRGLCSALADQQGEPLDITELRRKSGVSVPTIKKLLYAFEAMFLIRTLLMEGGRKGPVVFFEDMAEAESLRTNASSLRQKIAHFCFTQFRAQFDYRLGDRIVPFCYQTRGGARVPLAYRGSTGALGIIPLEKADEAGSFLASANSFLKTYNNSKVILVHAGAEKSLIQPRLAMLPLAELV